MSNEAQSKVGELAGKVFADLGGAMTTAATGNGLARLVSLEE